MEKRPASGSGTPGPGRSSWRSRSCGPGRTSRGSWSTGTGRRGRWPRSSRGRTCWARLARRVEKLAASLGVIGLSKSQVSAMAAELDKLVEVFRSRPLDARPRASSAPCGSSARTFTGPGRPRRGTHPAIWADPRSQGRALRVVKRTILDMITSGGPDRRALPGDCRKRRCKADVPGNRASTVSPTVPGCDRAPADSPEALGYFAPGDTLLTGAYPWPRWPGPLSRGCRKPSSAR